MLLAYNASERLQIYQNLGLHLLRFRAEVEVITPENIYWEGAICLDENGQSGPCENWTESAYLTNDRVGGTSILYLGQELGIRYKLFEKVWLQSGVDISYRLHSQIYGYGLRYTMGSSWGQPVTTQLSV